jgi:membrane-associated phospholipid phosphatase
VRSLRSTRGVLRGPLPGVLLAASFVIVTLLSLRPLISLDTGLKHAFDHAWPQLDPYMLVVAKSAQRMVMLPPLFGLAIFFARRRRSWEPLVVTLVSVLMVNFVVGVLKLATARDRPLSGDPMFFEQGVLYPSGHAANVITYFGLAVWLVRWYGTRPDGPLARSLLVLTWVACIGQIVSLLYLQFHWFTDIVGGLLIGGAVLRSTVYERGVVRRLADFAERVLQHLLTAWRRHRTSRAGETHAKEPVTAVNGEAARLPQGSSVSLPQHLHQPDGRGMNGAGPDPEPVRPAVPERQLGE